VHKNGQVAIVQTNGNQDCHVILRGGKAPNYDAASVAAACADLAKAKLPSTLMVDCSHANSSKQHEKQLDVAKDIAGQIGGRFAQRFRRDGGKPPERRRPEVHPGQGRCMPALEYGKSITDACLGWDDSVESLEVLSDRRQGAPRSVMAPVKKPE